MTEFQPQDFSDFIENPDTMCRYQQCATQCLLFNFSGAVEPGIQNIMMDAKEGPLSDAVENSQCSDCKLSDRELQIAVLLLIDALL